MMFYDLFLYIKLNIYNDLVIAFNLFDFLTVPVFNDITLSMILATFITIGLVVLVISFVVKLLYIPFKLLRGV